MNKKIIGIVIGLLVVVAIIIGLFVLKPWAPSSQDEGNQVDNSELADELDDYIPDMDKEEIEDTLDQELSDEQKDAFNEAINDIKLPDIEDITVDEDGTMSYADEDGNIVVVEPDEEIKGMTEDEIQQQSDEVDQMLQDIINGASGNPSDPGDEGNNSSGQISTGNPNNQDNTGTGNQDNTEQEVYEGDTENTVDNSRSLEELEQAMKDAMEENNGVGSTTGPLTEETIEGITGSIELVP